MNWQKTISNMAMTCMAVLYLLDILLPLSAEYLTAAAAAVVLLVNLPRMGKTFRLPAWIFALVGAGALLAQGAPLEQWLSGLNAMMNTAVILIVMQTLSLAMHRGGNDLAVSRCLQAGTQSMAGLFCMVMLLAHLLASVMSLGSVVVILAAIQPALEGRMQRSSRFMAASVSWGYCTLFLWAPGTVTVLMSMQIFSLSWQEYFLPAFAISMLGMGVGAILALLIFRGKRLPDAAPPEETPRTARDAWRKVGALAAVLGVIVAGITVLERLQYSTATGRLLVVTLAVSGAWLLAQGKRPGEAPVLRMWWDRCLPGNRDLSAFFLSMGLFSAAIQYSGFDRMLTELCQAHQAFLNGWVLPLLPVVIVLFSLVGLHPFVSVLMVGPILAGMSLAVTPLQLGLAMSLGCCLSYMLSPFAGLILALSGGLRESPVQICAQANLGYAAVYYFLATGAIALLG